MSLVTVKRNQETSTNTNVDAIKPALTSLSENDNLPSPLTTEESTKIVKKINFEDLKAIYSSSSKSLPGGSNNDDSKNQKTANFSLFHRKTIPRNKPTSGLNENNSSQVSPNSHTMGSFFKRSSLNSIDLSASPNSKTTPNSLCIQIKSDEEPTPHKKLPSKSNSFSSPNKATLANPNIVDPSPSHLIEKYFVVKDAALILPRRLYNKLTLPNINIVDGTTTANHVLKTNSTELSVPLNSISKLLAFKSAREIVPSSEDSIDNVNSAIVITKPELSTGDILIHLQYMISWLRPTDTIILAVKLCSYIPERIRYLVIVETSNSDQSNNTEGVDQCEESTILGFDLQPTVSAENKENCPPVIFSCTIGLVSPIYANCEISLDGDGGFKFKSYHSTHIFKPVSIQAMWSAYQYLHKALENARKYNHYATVITVTDSTALQPANTTTNHEWVKYYSSLICKNNKTNEVINEWYQKEERSALREDFTTPYFDCLQLCKEQEETGIKIREKLREIMSSSKDDYGSMSSVHIRQILEKELGLKLDNFKKFVDATIFQFYNQLVECATQILPNLFLGTEWNASNYDSLQTDRITHILNISSEIDNFFPDNFKYLNIRVRDVDETDLLKEFDRTNKFIQEAREQGTGCLVHCKMGVSRSASCVIAYLMKEFNWSLEQTFQFTKQKRNCINPNDGFKQQLLTYESILNAHRAKYNLFESTATLQSLNNSPTGGGGGMTGLPCVKVTDSDNGICVKDAVTKIKLSISPNQSTAQLVSPNSVMTTSNTIQRIYFQQ